MMDINPKARQKGLVVQEMPDEVLVYDLDTNEAHCLNSSAAFVWRSCDGSRTVNDIVSEFAAAGMGKVSEDFVWLALDQLQENDLLENEIQRRFDGRSRRQVLKTIGIASVVAIPVIASLVAPPAALAAVSCICQIPLDCTAINQQNPGTNCPTAACNASNVCSN